MSSSGKERRRHDRHRLPAVVAISPEVPGSAEPPAVEGREVYLVDNLSGGGALVTGGKMLPVGTRVAGVVEMAGEAPFELSGVVVRTQERSGRRAFAVSFDTMNAMTMAVFEIAIRRCRARYGDGKPGYVLVLDGDGRCRRALARDFERLGKRCIGVSSPVNAISLLEAEEPLFDAVIIDLHLGGLTPEGVAFSEFLAENFPWVRRILISGELDCSEMDRAVRDGRAQRALRKPWSHEQLIAVIR